MKPVSSSELKAKLAKYLRMIREGEVIEVRDRGVPIAIIRGIERDAAFTTIPPSENAADIGKLVSKVKHPPKTDVVQLLMEDRRKK